MNIREIEWIHSSFGHISVLPLTAIKCKVHTLCICTANFRMIGWNSSLAIRHWRSMPFKVLLRRQYENLYTNLLQILMISSQGYFEIITCKLPTCVICFDIYALFFSHFFTRTCILSNTIPSSNITIRRIQKIINVSFKPIVSISSKGVLIVAFKKPLLERGLTVRLNFIPGSMDQWRLLSKGESRKYDNPFEVWLI